MSLNDSTCSLCGIAVDLTVNDLRKASSYTSRLWCGTCSQDRSQKIVQWLYSYTAEYPIRIARTTPVTSTHYRPNWDEYYMDIAFAVAKRGDCARRQHGAVIVKDHKIVSTGYNGTPPGDSRSCGSTGLCPRNLSTSAEHNVGEYDQCWATHAESNALLRASWSELKDATIYITSETPCPGCRKLIMSSGIARVFGTAGVVE